MYAWQINVINAKMIQPFVEIQIYLEHVSTTHALNARVKLNAQINYVRILILELIALLNQTAQIKYALIPIYALIASLRQTVKINYAQIPTRALIALLIQTVQIKYAQI